MLQPKDRLAEWIQKQDPHICCLQETHFRHKDTCRLKVRWWKNIFHANGKQNKAVIAILISDKIDLKVKITKDKEGQYIVIKGSIQEEDITIVNIYATSTRSSKKQESSRKTSISALLTMPKPLTVWITINCGKFWKRWKNQTTWPASWETCVQIKKQQLELDMKQ